MIGEEGNSFRPLGKPWWIWKNNLNVSYCTGGLTTLISIWTSVPVFYTSAIKSIVTWLILQKEIIIFP